MLSRRNAIPTRDIRADEVAVGMVMYPGDRFEMSNVARRGEKVSRVVVDDLGHVLISGRSKRWAWTCLPEESVRVAAQ